MIQSKNDLEDWYGKKDPWGYFEHPDDLIRKKRVLGAIPSLQYQYSLDIGCGNGFITNDLPGDEVIGIDISEKAILWASENAFAKAHFLCGSVFDIGELDLPRFNLVLITGVLYSQYIASSINLIYILVDRILTPGGILVCSHIYEWYKARFPYMTISREYFPYRGMSQVLEVYCK